MRVNSAARTALWIAAAVLTSTLVLQGTYALWNKAVPAGMGTIRSADFQVTLTGSGALESYGMTLPDGRAATISLITAPAGDLFPGEAIYAGVKIANATMTDSHFRIRPSTSVPLKTDTGSMAGLSDHLTVEAAAAPGLGDCTAGLGYSDPSLFSGPDIPKMSSAAICFRIRLSASAPSALQGASASISIPLRVDQT